MSGFSREVMAENLRALRARRRLSQREVARAIGVSEASIVNYENATSAPNYEVAWNLAALYGVSLDSLGRRE